MNYKLSKKIVHHILEKEINKTNVEVEILPVNLFENIYETIKIEIKNNKKIKPIDILKDIIGELDKDLFGRYYQLENILKVYLTTIKNASQNQRDYYWNLFFSTYHEYKHALVNKKIVNIDDFQINSLSNFYLLIDYLVDSISNYYQNNMFSFYEEVIADIYAYEKASKIIKKHSKLYQKLELYMERDNLFIQINSNNYDVQKLLNIINKVLKIEKTNTYFTKDYFPYAIIPIIYNEDYTFKEIKQLSKEQDWIKLPQEVKYLIISSKAYLSELDYKNITIEELEFVLEALKYNYNIEKQRKETNRKIRKEIYNFKVKVKNKEPKEPIIKTLIPTLEEKEIYNFHKLEYLDYKIFQITKILEQKKVKILIKKKVKKYDR